SFNFNADGSFSFMPEANWSGSTSFTYQVNDGSLASNEATVTLTVAAAPAETFWITAFDLTDNGFHLDFNRPVDLSVLNLYSGTDADMGASDLLFVRATDPSPVRGSLILDSDQLGATFIKTLGVLDAGDYSLTLYSGTDGWRADAANLLDGDGDGVAGDHYSRNFRIGSSTSAILGAAKVLAGPGQALVGYKAGNNVAPTDGLPITLRNAAGVTGGSFKLGYDPALFALSGVSFADGVTGSFTTADGVVSVSFTTPALANNNAYSLVRIHGGVLDTAIGRYGAKQVLDLYDVVLDGGRSVRVDDGLHLNAYPGDTSGNGDYDTGDTARMQRLVTTLDTGYGSYPLVDPSLVSDVNHDQVFSAIDRLLLANEVSFLADPVANASKDRREIDPIPAHAAITFTGADPLVDLPRDLQAVAGGVLTVPVRLDIAQDLDQVQLRLAWNSSQLELLAVRRGSLTGDFEHYVESRQAGSLTVDMSRLEKLTGGQGSVLELDFRVAAEAAGMVDIDLQWTQLNQTRLTLNPAPQPGADRTDGRVQVMTLNRAGEPPVALSSTVSAATPGREDEAVVGKGALSMLSPYRVDDDARKGLGQSVANLPMIDFGSRYDGFTLKSDGDKSWLNEWLTESESRKSRLETLRIPQANGKSGRLGLENVRLQPRALPSLHLR
ncbi:cadherin-like domain-containing protein, partial [Accumulibacter sp.]|uniref:cadherin-like domain-containing protein n=1 Tax=Accumulibacter sp. TaxID=2053492 RepID=UPI001A4C08DB